MQEKIVHKNGPSHKTARQGRAEQEPQPDLCKIYEILTVFMAKKLCLWYTVSDKRTAPRFLRDTYKKEKDHEDHLRPAHPVGHTAFKPRLRRYRRKLYPRFAGF